MAKGMDPSEKWMLVAGGVALVFSVAAIGLAMIQTLANPSGTFVVGAGVIELIGVIGMLGLAAFGVLWATSGKKNA